MMIKYKIINPLIFHLD